MSLVGYNPYGGKESDMTQATEHTHRLDMFADVLPYAYTYKVTTITKRKTNPSSKSWLILRCNPSFPSSLQATIIKD